MAPVNHIPETVHEVQIYPAVKMNLCLLLMATAASSSVYNSPLQVASWLTDMGLNIYSSECKRWNKSGRQILEASQQEIDKELRIANPLHRKKLHLALEGKLSYYYHVTFTTMHRVSILVIATKTFLAIHNTFLGCSEASLEQCPAFFCFGWFSSHLKQKEANILV